MWQLPEDSDIEESKPTETVHQTSTQNQTTQNSKPTITVQQPSPQHQQTQKSSHQSVHQEINQHQPALKTNQITNQTPEPTYEDDNYEDETFEEAKNTPLKTISQRHKSIDSSNQNHQTQQNDKTQSHQPILYQDIPIQDLKKNADTSEVEAINKKHVDQNNINQPQQAKNQASSTALNRTQEPNPDHQYEQHQAKQPQPQPQPQQEQLVKARESETNQLSYRVLSCSSQDSNFLASDLAAPTNKQNVQGWQSQRFCVYPQEISIQFPQPVKIQKIQFLMHESLIPQAIHLSSYTTGQHGQKFMPLGFFQLDDNTGSNYQSRELKTVYLDIICTHFRISISKNFDNRLNKFNQVGLVKMQFSGTYLGNYEISHIYNQKQDAKVGQQSLDPSVPHPKIDQYQSQNDLKPRNLKIQSVMEDEFDPELANKLRLLSLKKDQAVREEDFDLAMALKEICDRIKILGHKQINLEVQKIEAIQGEDFLAAKAIKHEIDNIKHELSQVDPLDPFNQSRNPSRTIDQSINQRDMNLENLYQEALEAQTKPTDGTVELNERLEEQDQQPYGDEEVQEQPQIQSSPNRRFKNYDDQAVPALALKQPIDFNQVNDSAGGGIGGSAKPDENESLEYRDIPATMKTFADSLLPYYGEKCCSKMFHRKWQFREEGVNEFVSEMPKVFQSVEKDGLVQLNSAILTVLVEILKDKVQQIITMSFEAVEQYIKQMHTYSALTIRAEHQSFEKMLTYILDRQTDSRLFAKTQKLYQKFYEIAQIDQTFLTSFLFKQSSYINKQNYNLTMHQALRLRIINQILLANLGTKDFPTDIVFPTIRSCVNASVADQRKAAQQLTVTLYKVLGWKKVEPLVHQGFGQKIILQLKAEIPEISAYVKKE